MMSSPLLSPSLAPVRLCLTATVDTPITFPGYAGNALRGAFGKALRALSCTTHASDCTDCPLLATCPYSTVFSPCLIDNHSHSHNDNDNDNTNTNTPPYLIEPYTFEAAAPKVAQLLFCEYAVGESLGFGMVLWGMGRTHLPLIIMAWQRALARGIGMRVLLPSFEASDDDVSPQRAAMGCATLCQVAVQAIDGTQEAIWSVNQPKLNVAALQAAALTPLDLNFNQAFVDLAAGCRLWLHSPLRIVQQGSALTGKQLNATLVLQALLRRCQQTGVLDAPMLAALPQIHDASKALTLMARVKWWDVRRYSFTQQQTMPLGGLIGYLDFVGDMRPYWALLYAAQWLHVGKDCVFGLGGYTVQALPTC